MDVRVVVQTGTGTYRVRMDKHGTFYATGVGLPEGEVELHGRPQPWPPEVGETLFMWWIGPLWGIPIPAWHGTETGIVRMYTMLEPIAREGAT